jgi:hypothetical protein
MITNPKVLDLKQYGGKEDKRLVAVITDLYKRYGLRHGIMRGFWASSLSHDLF